MFTTIAYQETRAGTTTYSEIAATPDQHITVVGDVVYIGALNQIASVAVCGNSEGRNAYLDSPSLRRLALLDISRVVRGVAVDDENKAMWMLRNPLPLAPNEGMKLFLKSSATTSAIMSGIVNLSDGPIAPVSGEIFTVQADATITTVAGVWTNGGFTLRQTLPVGRYQVVGASVSGGYLTAFRFVPVGYGFRPGGLCAASNAVVDFPNQRAGNMGVWFEFDQITPPSIDLLCSQEVTTELIYLDLIKIA